MHAVIIDNTISQGKAIVAESETEESLQESLDDLEKSWSNLLKRTNERQEQIDEVYVPSQNYSEATEDFLPALTEMEDIVGGCEDVKCEKHSLERERDLLKVMQLIFFY